jgi:release factor glutamine methyltransferase
VSQPPSLSLPLKGGGESKGRTLREAFFAAAQLFRESGIATPELDARLLLCAAAGLSHEAYVAKGDDMLLPKTAARFAASIDRRLRGEPVSRILGSREFYGRPFRIDANTLDPRPDTETLVEAALAVIDREGWRERPLRLLDIGTGSGCILITLLAELPMAVGVGVDVSLPALALARDNARALGVGPRASFVASDWLDAVSGNFDLVVANPPYIATADIGGLGREVAAHDPLPALDGGHDGLDAYRRILPRLRQLLQKGAIVLFETGADQAEAVQGLLGDAGLETGQGEWLWCDLGARQRVVGARA